MPNHALAVLTGHLGKEPELRKTQTGKDISTFTLAVKTGYGDNQKTTWWNCAAFGKTAEVASKFLKKGSAATVQGEPYEEEWEDRDGNKRKSIKLSVEKLILIDGAKASDSSKEREPTRAADETPFDDEIPFD